MKLKIIQLFGNPQKKREPEETRIMFPGGFIYVARVDQEQGKRPEWWIHWGVFHPDHPDKYRTVNLDEHGEPGSCGRIIDARVDAFDNAPVTPHELLGPTVDHGAIKIREVPAKKS